MPSALPKSEQTVLRATYHHLFISLGMTSGISHNEARVLNSTLEYGRQKGVLDLQVSSHEERINAQPQAVLMEMNARTLGNMGTGTIKRLYGHDYYSLYLHFALGDHQRLRPLAQPFKNGPQYFAQMLRIPATKSGIWAGGDACEELLEKHPDLKLNVSFYRCLYLQGMAVPDPKNDITVCVAFFHVYSRIARIQRLKDLLFRLDQIITLVYSLLRPNSHASSTSTHGLLVSNVMWFLSAMRETARFGQ